MKLKSIIIGNFKGISDPITVELAPVTLLFGANSVGKSTIIQALHYLREILECRNLDPGHTTIGGALDLGGFRNLVHNRNTNLAIKIGVEVQIEDGDFTEYTDMPQYYLDEEYLECIEFEQIAPEIRSAGLNFEIRWNNALNIAYVSKYSISLNGETIGSICASSDNNNVTLEDVNWIHPLLRPRDFEEWLRQGFTRETVRADRGDIVLNISDNLSDKSQFDQETVYLTYKPVTDDEKLFWSDDTITLDHARVLGSQLSSFINDLNTGGCSNLRKSPLFPVPLLQLSVLPDLNKELKLALAEPDEGIFDDLEFHNTRTANIVMTEVFVAPLALLTKWLSNFRYIGPLREIPSRNFQAERSEDESRWASGLAAWDVIGTLTDEKKSKINYWLGDNKLDTGYEILTKKIRELPENSELSVLLMNGQEIDSEYTEELYKTLPVKRRTCLLDTQLDIELQPADVGVGISQLLPVIVASIHTEGGILAIEQPELHIHPAWQVELGDLFIEQAIASSTLFLIETHSEHLLLRLLRRIRETTDNEIPPGVVGVSPSDISLYYVDKNEGVTGITKLRIDEEGEFIDRWPKGFFGERAEELF